MEEHIEQLKKERENQQKLLETLNKQATTVKIRQRGLQKLIKLMDDQIKELSGS